MDGSAELARAKRRHRADRRLGHVRSASASLSALILVIGLLSIAAYVWMTRTGRINAGLSDLQVSKVVLRPDHGMCMPTILGAMAISVFRVYR